MTNRETDVLIPTALWSAWKAADGSPRAVRRELTAPERRALQARVDELAPAMVPYLRPEDDDDVALALSDMFGGFPSMRAAGADAVGKIDSAMRLLAPFPLWAIKLACVRVRADGYEVKDRDVVRMEKHWAPADPEIVAEVRRTLRLRSSAHDEALALLTAPVET